jgi:hypothetical protein
VAVARPMPVDAPVTRATPRSALLNMVTSNHFDDDRYD